MAQKYRQRFEGTIVFDSNPINFGSNVGWRCILNRHAASGQISPKDITLLGY